MKKKNRFLKIIGFIVGVLLILSVAQMIVNSVLSGMNHKALTPFVSTLEQTNIPNRKIIAMGEATHGNKEFTEIKQAVFQKTVQQHGARTFVIEGDFGGSRKVNDYITGKGGNLDGMPAEIGFQIYNTVEMKNFIQWMHDYNQGKDEKEMVQFYGFDMQRYDNNKDYLFSYLTEVDNALAQEYLQKFEGLTDEGMFDQSEQVSNQALIDIDALSQIFDTNKDIYISQSSEAAYELTLEHLHTIKQNTELRIASDYATQRDNMMAEKIAWISTYQGKTQNNDKLFLAGHNGHLEKETHTMGTLKTAGQILFEQFGEQYFSIGTEGYHLNFLAKGLDTEDGGRAEYQLINKSNKLLAANLHEFEMDTIVLDFASIPEDSKAYKYLSKKQLMTSVGDEYTNLHSKVSFMHTMKMNPTKSYDMVIFIDELTPSTML